MSFRGPGIWRRPTHNPDRLKKIPTLFTYFILSIAVRATRDATRDVLYVLPFVAASEEKFDPTESTSVPIPAGSPRSVFPQGGNCASSRSEEMYLIRRISLSTLLYLSHCRSYGPCRFPFSVSLTVSSSRRRGRSKGGKIYKCNLFYVIRQIDSRIIVATQHFPTTKI